MEQEKPDLGPLIQTFGTTHMFDAFQGFQHWLVRAPRSLQRTPCHPTPAGGDLPF